MGYAFISYSTKNKDSADGIKSLFNKNGIETWMAPNDIPAGSKYAEVISKALKNCSCLVLLLTNNSQNSLWVAKKVERAINYKKVIRRCYLK
ncbi:MAG: toll/interleukin-1 receptor domain-containing protein [Clostridia bacterium]|nr:toll/interleukin-1 receptor domain-containing protein [Clostridia bacterium]